MVVGSIVKTYLLSARFGHPFIAYGVRRYRLYVGLINGDNLEKSMN